MLAHCVAGTLGDEWSRCRRKVLCGCTFAGNSRTCLLWCSPMLFSFFFYVPLSEHFTGTKCPIIHWLANKIFINTSSLFCVCVFCLTSRQFQLPEGRKLVFFMPIFFKDDIFSFIYLPIDFFIFFTFKYFICAFICY